MLKVDEHNLTLVESAQQVDEENASFYNCFPYPSQPVNFDYPEDPGLYTRLLNQNLGFYTDPVVPTNAAIWVAGCGTNQGIYTGLRFPNATVVGSDLSAASLDLSRKIGMQVGLRNLTLCKESINESEYVERFDYVICTGVVHHNANPAQTLKKLADSLKPSGVLELMVYNRYHRLLPQAFQKVIRLMNAPLSNGPRGVSELQLVRKIMKAFKTRNLMYGFLERLQNVSEQQLADVLIQPVEYSYTVESLAELADSCGLELLAPCPVATDGQKGVPLWYVELKDAELTRRLESLPDVARWQAVNLLLLEQSPMLWFYLGRIDSERPHLSEHEINERFLATVFERTKSQRRAYVRKMSGSYELSSQQAPIQRGDPEGWLSKVYHAVDGHTPMRQIFYTLGIPADFGPVLQARTGLASSLCPYLESATNVKS